MQQFDFLLNLPVVSPKRGGNGAYCLITVGSIQTGGSGYQQGQGSLTSDLVVQYTATQLQDPATINASKHIVMSAALPMPNNPDVGYGADWTIDDTSSIERVIGGAANLIDGNSHFSDYSVGGMYADTKGAVVGKLVEIGNSIAFRKAIRDFGLAHNPHKEIFYQGPRWRSFNLDWNLAFKNKKEADSFDDFVAGIAMHMSPDFAAGASSFGAWTLPDTFFIEYVNAKTRKIGACVCTGFNVRYADSGAGWKGFKDDGNPAMVAVSMNLLELTPITQADVLAGK